MIITCPNCKKNFRIDHTLIHEDGRDLKCGSCDHIWFYKVEDVDSKPLLVNQNIDNNEFVPDEVEIENDDKIKKSQVISNKITLKEDENTKKIFEKQKKISLDKKKNTVSKFFSYLIVFIISFVALIILLDTLKIPLINIFPTLEIFLFNLFELLKDIKLFIIDLILISYD